MIEQTEMEFVATLRPQASPTFPFDPQQALSLYAKQRGQRWLRVNASRALRLNARSKPDAEHGHGNSITN